MTVKFKNANGKWAAALEASSLPDAPEMARSNAELAGPTVSEDIAAWWAGLDAEIRNDGVPASAKEVAAIDAMPSVDVTDSVARLMSILPPPPAREPAQVLAFKRVEDTQARDAFHPVAAETECSSWCMQTQTRPRCLDVEQDRELWLERYFAEASSDQLQDVAVWWVNFDRGARLRPLTSALRLAREIAATEHHTTFRCLTLDGRGEDRYSARWSFLVDWLREHHSRSRSTTWKVLNSLHRVLNRNHAQRSWTFRQLRTTVVFTVIGADEGHCETRVWRSTFIDPPPPIRPSEYVEAGVPMTVIDGDDVMSVVPHSVDDAMRSAVLAYLGYEHHADSSSAAPSYLPMIKAVLDGEKGTAHH